jgi:hypothetical protein
MNILSDYYRCPPEYWNSIASTVESLCAVVSGSRSDMPGARLCSRYHELHPNNPERCPLNGDMAAVVQNLRLERYCVAIEEKRHPIAKACKDLIRSTYYLSRPLMGVSFRRHLQRAFLRGWKAEGFPDWPVDTTVEAIAEHGMRNTVRTIGKSIPFVWFWPERKSSCAIMTHDVETEDGLRFCPRLMDIDDEYRIKSSFQLVPESRYQVEEADVEAMRSRGFEPNVHDFNHDGTLFTDAAKFPARARKINDFRKRVGARGFRAGALYRNEEWFAALEFEYDMSVPNSARLDPQHGGCCTVLPYFVDGIIELPVTMIQDYSLFHIFNDYSTEIWQTQAKRIMAKHGLMSIITHPDYLMEDKPQRTYRALLDLLSGLRATANVWCALPHEVAEWWKARSQMIVHQEDGGWRVQGPQSERASVAWACVKDGAITYSFEER